MDLSPFEQTPRELLWQIIKYAPETLFKLRATSPVIKSSVDAYALSESKISVLTIIFQSKLIVEFIVPRKIRFPTALCIQIRQTAQIRPYLELSKNYEFGEDSAVLSAQYGSPLAISKSCTLDRLSDERLCELKRRQPVLHTLIGNVAGTKHLQRIELDLGQPSYEKSLLLLYLQDCSGHKIAKVNLSHCDGRAEMVATTRILEGKEIGRLCFTSAFSSDDLNMVKQIGVLHCLDLTVKDTLRANAVFILLELCTIVRSLKLQSEKNFKGFEWEDFVPIILDMFSRKVDKLHLSNLMPLYLTAKSANLLKQKLPLIHKKIWFKTDFGDGLVRNERYEINGNVVQVEVRGFQRPVLSVIHSTRVDEEL